MYGLLIESVCEFIKEKFGENDWLRIRDKSRVHEYTFVTHRMYSEKIIPRLAQAVHECTGYSKEQFMDETGVQFVKFLNKYEYDKMLRVLGRSLRDFLNGLDNLHEYLRFSYPKMKPPSFFCTDESLEGLTLHYRTRRKGYTHYVKGQLRQVAKQFYNQDVSVIIVEEKQSGKDNFYVKFRINFDNKEYTERIRLSSVMNGHAQLRANLFFDVFPFHIVFGNDMKIRNSGRGLNAVLPGLEGQLLNEAFEMKRPNLPLKWDSISNHENCVFELASTSLIAREFNLGCPIPHAARVQNIGVCEGVEVVEKVDGTPPSPVRQHHRIPGTIDEDDDSSEGALQRKETDEKKRRPPHPWLIKPPSASRLQINPAVTAGKLSEILEEVYHPRQIRLKGQMLRVPEWRAYIFLATPMLPDIEVMFQTGLYINDLSMHDSSRDLVLAGTQQSAELKLALDQELRKSSQLEESMAKLDQEMKRTDSLLYQMIPRQVAEKLRRGDSATSTCEVFSATTILFSDVVGFTTICSMITPMAVVSMLNGMYTKFDNLSELYDVYKVETIGDAYMVVSGAPIATKYHAVRIAEMALAMRESMNDLMDPSSQSDTVKIRVGIHSGMVVAGVVGLKMPRYCLFGDTVNTASRMESTGCALKIHMSETTKLDLDQWPGYYDIEERGTTEVKGKGSMKTYWLHGKTHDRNVVSPLTEALEEKAQSRSRQSSIDNSSPVLRRSLAGSRMEVEGDSRSGSVMSRPYTPLMQAEMVGREITPATSLGPNDNVEKLSVSSTETIRPISSVGGGDGLTNSRRESKTSIFQGYIPVTPSISDSAAEANLKPVCTCHRRKSAYVNREVQTDDMGPELGKEIIKRIEMNSYGGLGEKNTLGNPAADERFGVLDAPKGPPNVAHSSACCIL